MLPTLSRNNGKMKRGGILLEIPEHEEYHGEESHPPGSVEILLIVAHETAIGLRPGDGALHDPPSAARCLLMPLTRLPPSMPETACGRPVRTLWLSMMVTSVQGHWSRSLRRIMTNSCSTLASPSPALQHR